MAKAKNNDMTADEQARWDKVHSPEYITAIWAGGEHLRAGALAAEAELSDKAIDDLDADCPGIREFMPAKPGDVRAVGTVPGDPVRDELDRRETDPAGTPRNDGIDKPTLHPLDHDGDGRKGGTAAKK